MAIVLLLVHLNQKDMVRMEEGLHDRSFAKRRLALRKETPKSILRMAPALSMDHDLNLVNLSHRCHKSGKWLKMEDAHVD